MWTSLCKKNINIYWGLRRKHWISYTEGKIKNTAVIFLQCFQEFAVQSLNKAENSSGWSEVTSGVPQGSILGPLLFLVYINDFPLAVKCNCGLFADDSILHRKVTSESDWKILKLTSIVPMTGVTPGLLLWSPKSPRSYTYRDPRIHIIMSTSCLTNPYQQ